MDDATAVALTVIHLGGILNGGLGDRVHGWLLGAGLAGTGTYMLAATPPPPASAIGVAAVVAIALMTWYLGLAVGAIARAIGEDLEY